MYSPKFKGRVVFEIPAVFDCCSDMRADMVQITHKLENIETQQEYGHQVQGVSKKKYPLLVCLFLSFLNTLKRSKVHFSTAPPLQNPKITI